MVSPATIAAPRAMPRASRCCGGNCGAVPGAAGSVTPQPPAGPDMLALLGYGRRGPATAAGGIAGILGGPHSQDARRRTLIPLAARLCWPALPGGARHTRVTASGTTRNRSGLAWLSRAAPGSSWLGAHVLA